MYITHCCTCLLTVILLFLSLSFFFQSYAAPPDLHSFPTRRSSDLSAHARHGPHPGRRRRARDHGPPLDGPAVRSEEHTSELQSLRHLVCRLLLEKKKKKKK